MAIDPATMAARRAVAALVPQITSAVVKAMRDPTANRPQDAYVNLGDVLKELEGWDAEQGWPPSAHLLLARSEGRI